MARVGRFQVLRRLANGATTDVLLARAEGVDGVVALKILLQQFRSDPAFEQSFVREAAAYASLTHPAIVKLYDFFAVDGQFVMVLEYVDGLPLHKLRAMLSIGGEKVEDSAALFVASRIFEALAAAHMARDPSTGDPAPVIHRDINPSNVLVPWNANVKVSDFGIAKAGGTQADTKMGFVKGTYGYLAPEQVRGANVTVRADVYAASLLLWELLARRKAIQRGAMSEAGVLQAMAQPEFPSLDVVRPDIDPLVREAVRRGLAVDPAERSITAEEMVGILAGAMKVDEGRATLAQAIARVRPAPSEPDESTRLKDAEASVDRALNGSIRPEVRFSPSKAPGRVLGVPAEIVKPVPVVESKDPPPVVPDAAPPASSSSLASELSPAPAPVVPPAAAPPPSASVVAATPAVASAAAIGPVAASRSIPPGRNVARVVGFLAALVGVGVVAFCLWSQEEGRPPSVVVIAPSSAPTVSARPPASPPSVAPPVASRAPAPVVSASSAPANASANSSVRVAMPAGSDPDAAAAGLGDMFTPLSAGGHRVFMDGRVVGQSPATLRVHCGKHEFRIGGNGLVQTVDVPCGGSVLVNPKWPAPSEDSP